MEETKRNQLGTRLKQMFDEFFEETRRKQIVPQTGTGNIIRRRQGQKEKRLSFEKCGTAVEQAE